MVLILFNTLFKKFSFKNGKTQMISNLIPVSKTFFRYRCLIVKISLQTKRGSYFEIFFNTGFAYIQVSHTRTSKRICTSFFLEITLPPC